MRTLVAALETAVATLRCNIGKARPSALSQRDVPGIRDIGDTKDHSMAPTSETKRQTDWTVCRWLTGLSILACLAWAPRTSLLFLALCAGTPVELDEADLNHDGYVSVIEAGYACNVDSRPVKHDGRSCTEYYSKADWRTIKEVCD